MRRSVVARELPIRPFRKPVGLLKAENGKLDPALLVAIRPSGHLYVSAAKAWQAMRQAAKADGVMLKPTSTWDAYRPVTIQRSVFFQRYTTEPTDTTSTRLYEGRRYYLKKGLAPLATPGTSNHGWGCAVDVWNVGKEGRLEWLLANYERFGWSHELQSEPWHIRYVLGDDLPDGVS